MCLLQPQYLMPTSKTIPLQVDMFTGQSVDTRSRNQKQADEVLKQGTQQQMFSIQDVPFGGKRAKPIVDISQLPSPQLELISEDPRSEEEKALARKREMESNTYRLFEDTSLYETSENSAKATEMEVTQVITPNDLLSSLPCHTQSHKEVSFLEIVAATRENLTTQWVDRVYASKLAMRVPLALQEALSKDVLPSEIACAIQIGESMGQRDQEQSQAVLQEKLSCESQGVDLEQPETHQPPILGLRARLRSASISIRTR